MNALTPQLWESAEVTYRDALANAVKRADQLAAENRVLTTKLASRRRWTTDVVTAILVMLLLACAAALVYLAVASG